MNDGFEVRRNPERTRDAILQAAMAEIVAHGFDGARINEIAERSGSNKRMIYHYFGDKEALYAEVLNHGLSKMLIAETSLQLGEFSPRDGVETIVRFVWHYFLQNPEILSLLATENLHGARYLKKSANGRLLNHQLVEQLRGLLKRGAAEGSFRDDVDPLKVLLTSLSLSFFYLSNIHTLSTIFNKDLEGPSALTRWENHIVHVVTRSLS